MNRVMRMFVVLVAATILSSRLPVNFLVITLAALALEEPRLGDALTVAAASFCLDHLGLQPLGFSLLPLATLIVIIRLLWSRIYFQSLPSRFLWLAIAVLGFYLTRGLLLIIRGGASLYMWNAISMGVMQAAVEGLGAALLAPYLHRYLSVTWGELRRSREIVVR